MINYDRRGRGHSGDTPPYAVDREVDDIKALIMRVGGHASLFGSSSGSVLALAAANQFPTRVDRVVMFEPPFIVDDSRPPVGQPFADQLSALLLDGDNAGAVKHFMKVALGMPRFMVTMMRLFPGWKKMTTMARTLPYDLAVMGDTQQGTPLPADRWSNVTMPTLVIIGDTSEAFFHDAAQQLAERLSNAHHLRLDKANHAAVVAAPKRIASAIMNFADASTPQPHVAAGMQRAGRSDEPNTTGDPRCPTSSPSTA